MNFYRKYEITARGFDTADPIYCSDLMTALEQEHAGQHAAYRSAYDGQFYTLDPETAGYYTDLETAEDTAQDLECLIYQAAYNAITDPAEATRSARETWIGWTDFIAEVDRWTAAFLHPYPAMRNFADYLYGADSHLYDPFFDLCAVLYPYSFAWSRADLQALAGDPRFTAAGMQLIAEHVEDVRAYSIKEYRARRVGEVLFLPGLSEAEYLADAGGHLTAADRGAWYDVYPAGIVEYHL